MIDVISMTLGLCVTCAVTLLAQDSVPPPKLDPQIFDRYLGTYELPSGRLLVVARTERRLYLYEPGTEQIRGLERLDDRTWIGGPSLLVHTPEQYRLTFHEDARGEIASLRYVAAGTGAEAKKTRLYREEAVSFRNGDVTPSGTLLLPTTKGPHPAIVLGHGSGAQDRNGYAGNIRFMADHLARHGVAALTYDKRGSARSTGDWSTASFADLAGDLNAGIRLLRGRADIIASQVGAGGSSLTTIWSTRGCRGGCAGSRDSGDAPRNLRWLLDVTAGVN